MISKLDPRDIHRTPNINIAEHISSSMLGTRAVIDHKVDSEANFDKFQEIEIIYSIFSDHDRRNPTI